MCVLEPWYVNWPPLGPVRELDLSPQLNLAWQFYLHLCGHLFGKSIDFPASSRGLTPQLDALWAQLSLHVGGGRGVLERKPRCPTTPPDWPPPMLLPALPAWRPWSPKESFVFYDQSLDKRDLGQGKHWRGKTKEMRCRITAGEGLDFNSAKAAGESRPRRRNPRTLAWYSGDWEAPPLLFKTKLLFNLFLSFISQVSQHGAV